MQIAIIGICAFLLALLLFEAIYHLSKLEDIDTDIYEPYFDEEYNIQGFRKVKR